MRVAIVASSETRGGAEEYLYRLYTELASTRAVEPVLVGHLPDWPAGIGSIESAGVTVKLTRRHPLLKQSIAAVRSVPRIVEAVDRLQPDIVHIQFFKEKLVLPGILSGRGHRILWTEHSPLPGNFPPGGVALLRRQAGKSNVIAISRAVKDSLDSTRIRSHLIENPLPKIEKAKAREGGESDSSPLVVYAGRLHRNKRVEILLKAARLLPGIRFGIAGEGPSEGELRSLSSPNVEFYGNVSNMQDLYARCSMIIIPSGRAAREGSPMVMLEARMSGVRVLMAGDCHALEESLSLGCTSFEPNPQALADAIVASLRVPATGLAPSIIERRSTDAWAEMHYEAMERTAQ